MMLYVYVRAHNFLIFSLLFTMQRHTHIHVLLTIQYNHYVILHVHVLLGRGPKDCGRMGTES